MKKIILLAVGALLVTGVFAAPVVTALQTPPHAERQAPGPHKKHRKRHHHGKKHHHPVPVRK